MSTWLGPAGVLRREPAVIAASLAGVALVALVDWATGWELALSILYLLPIGFAVWFGRLRSGLLLAFVSAAVWLTVERLGEHVYSRAFIPYWNAAVRLGFFLLTTFLLHRVRLLTRNLETQVWRRTAALAAEVEQRKHAEREIAETSQREQERLAYELHDQLGSHLAGVAFQAQALAESLERRALPETAEARQIVGLVNRATGQIRELVRLLAPLQDVGGDLGAALAQLGADLEHLFRVRCQVEVSGALPALSKEQSHQLYRIAQEAARNAIQHGRAKTIGIALRREPEALTLVVRSDGEPLPAAAAAAAGSGLRIMRYRAELLGGTFALTAGTGGSTKVVCQMPIDILPATPRPEAGA